MDAENAATTLQKYMRELLAVRHYQKERSHIILCQACIRAHLARKRYLPMLKKLKRRNFVASEILATEKSYVKNLILLSEVFIKPMRTDFVKYFGKSEMPISIMKELDSIIAYNSLLLQRVTERLAHWSAYQKLGDIFLQFTDFLKIYCQYVNNYEDVLRLINSGSKNQPLRQFMKECNHVLRKRMEPGVIPLDFEGYLIQPIQRIPRYNLLLKELLLSTWETHPDYNELKKANEKMLSVADFVNQSKKTAENL